MSKQPQNASFPSAPPEALRGFQSDLLRTICSREDSGDDRLRIYRYAYRARLRGVLATNHAALIASLEPTRADVVMEKYIEACPSRHPSLRQFGNELPRFLAALSAAELGHPPAGLAALATFERTLLDVFDAADGPVVNYEELRGRPQAVWPSLRFRLHPSMRILTPGWNVLAVWKASSTPQRVALQEREESIFLWRTPTGETKFRSAAPMEAAGLELLQSGKTLAESCDALQAEHQEVPVADILRALAGWLRAWTMAGFFTRLSPGLEPEVRAAGAGNALGVEPRSPAA